MGCNASMSSGLYDFPSRSSTSNGSGASSSLVEGGVNTLEDTGHHHKPLVDPTGDSSSNKTHNLFFVPVSSANTTMSSQMSSLTSNKSNSTSCSSLSSLGVREGWRGRFSVGKGGAREAEEVVTFGRVCEDGAACRPVLRDSLATLVTDNRIVDLITCEEDENDDDDIVGSGDVNGESPSTRIDTSNDNLNLQPVFRGVPKGQSMPRSSGKFCFLWFCLFCCFCLYFLCVCIFFLWSWFNLKEIFTFTDTETHARTYHARTYHARTTHVPRTYHARTTHVPRTLPRLPQ